ncbi:MAG: hypothetical protein RL091_1007 [Verrucomicrobiota bacterium]|jgi:hypothetical protein
MNPCRLLFLTFLGTLAGSTLHATSPGIDPAVIYPAWTGRWQGVLEYRDYQPPHGRVTLPTTLTVTPTPDAPALLLAFVFDDGPNKTVRSTSRLTLDPASRSLIWSDEGKPVASSDRFSLSEASPTGDRLVFLGESMDDNKPARIRYTFLTEPGTWRILKETTSDNPDFAFRHEYRFAR